MTRRSAVVLALVAAVAAGCGGDARRQAVDDYVADVNAASLDARLGVAQLNKAYANISRARPADLRRFARAERLLADYERRLRALDPPPAAARLQHDLVALAAAQRSFAHEVTLFARYDLALPPVSRELNAATARARERLGRTKDAARERAALVAYAGDLGAVDSHLARLRPPPALAPAYSAQRARVAHLRRLSLDLADALRRGDRARVASLSAAYRAAGDVDLGAARAQAAAVRAYNARLRRIYRLGARVDGEHRKLADSVR